MATKYREYQKNYYNERREKGLCHDCPNPTKFNEATKKYKWMCTECARKNYLRDLKKKAKKEIKK